MFVVRPDKVAVSRSRGFSLIEVLVTVLIFSVGLLGIASMQSNGLRIAKDADLMANATMLVVNMSDRMRSMAPSSVNNSCTLDVDDDTGANSCASEQTTEIELWDAKLKQEVLAWQEDVTELLPDGDGSVVQSGDEFEVSVSWDESADSIANEGTDDAGRRTYSMVVVL